ncbi:tyrosine transporter [Pelomyxa schiedti]|nr:tyrosine transporter [Pelomyxa schiedti]
MRNILRLIYFGYGSTAAVVSVAFVLVAIAPLGANTEISEPFTPGGCVNEYQRDFVFDVPSSFYVLYTEIELQAPDYEAEAEQPALVLALQRRTPLDSEVTEKRTEKLMDNDDVRSLSSSTSSRSGSSSSEPMPPADTHGEWVIADDSLECVVAAKRFKCVKNYDADQWNHTDHDVYRFSVSSHGNSTSPVCLVFTTVPLGKIGQYQAYFAGAVFIVVFTILAFELVSRAIVTMLGDVVLFGLLWAFQSQPTLESVMSWLDWRTMVLLTSMMIAVAVFAETGFFEFAAWQVLKFSKKYWSNVPVVNRKWRILLILGAMTAAASAFLDNCTTVLLFAPVTVRMARLLESDPLPLLVSMIYFCTMGGAMTYVGDPPNLIIGGQFELGFNDFIINCSPPILFILPFAIVYIYLVFRKRMRLVVKPGEVVDEKTETKASGHVRLTSKHEDEEEPDSGPLPGDTAGDPGSTEIAMSVAEDSKLPTAEVIPSSAPETPGATIEVDPEEEKRRKEAEMDAEYRIRDKKTFLKSVIILGIMLVFFLLESVTLVSTTWVAVIGSGILLLITTPRQIAPILEKVEWPTLFFFAYLFVFVKLVEKLGVILLISELTITLIEAFPVDARLPMAMMIILWMSALLACWCNNIAFTASIIPLIYYIANKPGLGVPLRPLAWTLALGVAMSANATLIAAAPNLIVAQIAGRAGYTISFLRFLAWGFPFMLYTTALISGYLLCVYWWWGFSG